MKKINLIVLVLLPLVLAFGQQEFHVFPENHKQTPGLASGDGSLQLPWDLQTALKQTHDVVNGGDTIWLHEGIYTGRFISTLSSNIKDKYITVSAFKNDKVVLNGNVEAYKSIDSKENQVLAVKGGQVIFKDFEVTCLGDYLRDIRDENFKFRVSGVNHFTGKNCKFINLRIYNLPGLGIGSWNTTGGSLISDCVIYNNGIINEKGQGRGVGIYVQNSSDQERIIKDNVIFSNYYKGIEVWSAGRNAKFDYVKNITLDNNVIFNSGLSSNYWTVDNVIIGTDDRNGLNIAKNITVKNNILYHNTQYKTNQINGDAPSLTLGYYHKTPVENLVVKDNIILGRNNALRILQVKSLTFTNNIVYSGYVLLNKSILTHAKTEQWQVSNNQYFTKKKIAFRVMKDKDYTLSDWKSVFSIEENSEWNHVRAFNLPPVLDITKNDYTPNQYRVVLFNKLEEDVTVDFSNYDIKPGSSYSIKDVEDLDAELKSGILNDDLKITVPMKATNPSRSKTLDNFGVFIIDFNTKQNEVQEEESDNIFKRFWRFLGF